MPVTRSKSIVEQVNEILRQRIHDATYQPGARLPSESELAEEFGVSRATVRTVLAKLSVEGLILRRQGDGTYVNCDAYIDFDQDCDDGDGNNYPGNSEQCDGQDNDCSGTAER